MMNDFRYAVRFLLRSPAFTLSALMVLSLGIGLNVTVFSILNVLLFKPPPVHDPRGLVWITGRPTESEPAPANLSYPDLVDLGSDPGVMSGVTGFAPTRLAVTAGARSARVDGELVPGNYFQVLGVTTAVGRLLTPDDDRPGATGAVAVMGDALWQRLFDRRADAIGQEVVVNGERLTVVGVSPRGFVGFDVLSPAEVWIPLRAAQRVGAIASPYDRDQWWLRVVGRLAPGVSRPTAEVALQGVAAAIARAEPASHKNFSVLLHAVGGASPFDRGSLRALALLPLVPLSVLLIACANVTSLLLARGLSRHSEIAVRIALGASRGRLMRQFLIESVTLAGVSGAASLLLAMWTPDLLSRFTGAPLVTGTGPDVRVVGFAALVCLIAAVAFGLMPALRASALPRAAPLRGGPGSTAADGKSARLQRLLVGAQLAVSLVLLMATGLFLQTVYRAGRADVGFETDGRLTLSLDLKVQRYSDARAAAFYRQILERTAAVPGVREASYAADVPLGGRVTFNPIYPAGRPVDPDARPLMTAVNFVGPRFFETIRLPIHRGRALTDQDRAAVPRVAVVNEAMAATLSPDSDVIGQRVSLGDPAAAPVEIVGISGNAVIDEFGEAPSPTVFLPHRGEAGEVSFILWTALPPATVWKAVESIVRAADASVVLFDEKTMTQHLRDRMDGERGLSRALGATGGLALGLAAFGLYGVLSYAVTRRTREIGVRVALGATRRDIVRLFMGEGLRIAAGGLVIGVIPGLALAIVLSGTLFGVRALDPLTTMIPAILLAVAALAASYLPVRRALRVDPMVALRRD